MKERLVRGTNLIGIVRILRARRHSESLPELGAWEQDLMRKRISRSTWYSLQVFDSLLQTVHRHVFDGSEAAAQNMGRESARALLADDPSKRVVVPEKPLASLQNMSGRWRDLFNFAEIVVTDLRDSGEIPADRSGARVRLSGFPDMSACMGHSIMGWSLEIVETSGGHTPSVHLEERPWMHNNVLQFVIDWS